MNFVNNYFFKQIDICNFEALSDAINSFKPNCIMHLAAESHVDNSFISPLNFTKTNSLRAHAFLL